MARKRIIKYLLNEEHLQAYLSLIGSQYAEHSHVHSFVQSKARNKNIANPFFQNGVITNFIAYENSRAVGHISAIIDPRLTDSDGTQVGAIGFYECNGDSQLSRRLIKKALQSLRKHSCTTVRAPIDLTTWHYYRFALNQNPKAVFPSEPINSPLYPMQFQQAGFTEASKYASLRRSDLSTMLSYSSRISEQLLSLGYSLRRVVPDNFSQAMSSIHSLSNIIFSSNWSFVNLSLPEFQYLYRAEQRIKDEAVIEILSNPEGKDIGFAFGFPNTANNEYIIKSIGILPEFRHTWGGIWLGGSQVSMAKNFGLNSVIFALRKREKITKNPIYEGSSVREYSAFERRLDS